MKKRLKVAIPSYSGQVSTEIQEVIVNAYGFVSCRNPFLFRAGFN